MYGLEAPLPLLTCLKEKTLQFNNTKNLFISTKVTMVEKD
jgi:hypothetical protein